MQWNILYIKTGSGQKLTELLGRKNIENFFPLSKVTVQYNGAKKIIYKALFPTYIFVRIREIQLNEFKKINGIINPVYWLGNPVAINNSDVIAIRHFINNYIDITVEKTTIENIVEKKINAGIESTGSLKSIAKVVLPTLGYILSAEVLPTNVRYISSSEETRKTKIIQKRLFNSAHNYLNSLL